MNRQEVAALLAYAVRLDPRTAPANEAEATERLDQWCDLLADVAATAPHPEGRHWDASQVVRRHIATSPFPIKPADIGGPWAAFRRDVLSRHQDPVPNVDPDDQAAYRAAITQQRHAIELGLAVATPRALLPGETGTRTQREEANGARLAALGTYVPRTVKGALASWRPRQTQRESLAAAGLPDPLNVNCPYEQCQSPAGRPCRGGGKHRFDRAPHPSRLELATTRHYAQETAV